MLVLASNSPRRKQLLALGGWDFSVLACDVDESVLPGEDPGAYVLRLAESKAWCALQQLPKEQREAALVLAADTSVVDAREDASGPVRFEILGKPADPLEAESMLRRLRGRTHSVYSGLAVLRGIDGAVRRESVITVVPMRRYSDAEMAAYIAGGDPFDKAGAYGIQHPTFRPVRNLQGCYPNVMGLPLCRVAAMLADFGLPPANGIVSECNREATQPCKVYRLATELNHRDTGSQS
jgi:MAF protein